MRRIVAMLATSALLVGALVGLSPQAAAAVWVFPSGSYTIDDGYGAVATITIRNLTVNEGSDASGYVRVDWGRYSCSTQAFSGTSALFSSPSGSEPCSGSVSFSVDAGQGTLAASAALTITSRVFAGPATPTAQVSASSPTVVPLQTCLATTDTVGQTIEFTWTDHPDATTYDVVVNGLVGASLQVPTGGTAGAPFSVLTPGTAYSATITAKRADGQTVAACTTNDAWTPPAAPAVTSTVVVAAGGLLTVNYSLPDPTGVQGVEYRIDGGAWLRPGGVAPVNGAGGSFTVRGLAAKDVSLTLRTVGADAGGPLVTEAVPAPVSFPKPPTSGPVPPGTAVGSPPAAPVAAPPASPTSSVPGTSNGAGSGANGALAAATGDAGIDAPCLAADGTLYPNQYSTVGSQLTMAPNTRGMGKVRSFTVVDGALAPGMQLDRTAGVLFGVTTSPGSYVTTVRAAFANGSTRTSRFTTRVDADPQTLQYAAQNIGVVGRASTIPPTTNAPVAGTTYRLVCGVLPDGMRLNTGTGAISGRPTKPVALPTPLRVAETSPSGSAAASFIVVVTQAGTSSISYPAHPHVRTGMRVAIRPTITGARDLVIFRTSKGKLPKGLRINKKTGTISGRPSHAGRVHTVTVVAVTRGGALLTAPPMRIRVRG